MAAIAALPSLFPHERPLGAPTQTMPALELRPKSLHRFFFFFFTIRQRSSKSIVK